MRTGRQVWGLPQKGGVVRAESSVELVQMRRRNQGRCKGKLDRTC